MSRLSHPVPPFSSSDPNLMGPRCYAVSLEPELRPQARIGQSQQLHPNPGTETTTEMSPAKEAGLNQVAEAAVELEQVPIAPSPAPLAPEMAQATLPEPELLPSLQPGERQGFGPVLRNQNFLKLWLGQVFSQLADKIYLVLMIALITSEFQSQGQTVSGWVSSIMVAFTIPAVLFGSVAGVYVDRWPKQRVLVQTNLWRGVLVLTLPLWLWFSQDRGDWLHVPIGFWILLVVTFAVSTLTQFFAPAESAVIPLIVERNQLLSANSLYTVTMMIAVVVGFAAGEPLLTLADTLTGYFGIAADWGRELVVGGCYALAGVILLFIRTQEKTESLNPNPPHVLQDLQEGLRYLGQQRQVRAALIQLVILFSVFAALAVLVVRLAEVIPELDSDQFGFLLAAGGVGMVLGVVLLGRLGQYLSHRQLSLIGSLGMAASLAGLAVFHLHLLPVVLLLMGLGACAALIGIPMQTTIQEETPEEMRGKVFGLQNNAVNVALSLPLVLAGLAETFAGLPPVLFGLSGITVLASLLTWSISAPKKA